MLPSLIGTYKGVTPPVILSHLTVDYCQNVISTSLAHQLKNIKLNKLLKFKYYDTCKKKSELVAIYL